MTKLSHLRCRPAVELYFVSSGIARSRETVERLREQALRELVDEKLQLQEARRVEISIEEEEIEREINRLSEGFSTSQTSITDFLEERGIKERTLESQIEAELAWSQFIRAALAGAYGSAMMKLTNNTEKLCGPSNSHAFW